MQTRPTRTLLLAFAFVLPLLVAPLSFTTHTEAGHAYEQPVWFNWDKTELNVIVYAVEAEPAFGARIVDAIESWETGIQQLAPAWLAESFKLNVYVVGNGVPLPSNVLADIAVVPQGFMATYTTLPGIAGMPVCYAFAPMAIGWGSLYHVALHEVGHCLGLGHVFNHGQEYSPAFDPMGGGQSGHRSCPSNLNMMVLERVFSGQGGTVTISSSAYHQANC